MLRTFGLFTVLLSSTAAVAATPVDRYDCQSRISNQLIMATPAYGEIMVYDRNDRLIKELDGMYIKTNFIETFPGQTETLFIASDGDKTVLTLTESEGRIVASFDGDNSYNCQFTRR